MPLEHLCKRAEWEKCFLCLPLFLGYHVHGVTSALSKFLSWSPMVVTDLSTLRNSSERLRNNVALQFHLFTVSITVSVEWTCGAKATLCNTVLNYSIHVDFHAMETPPMACEMFHFLCLEPGPFLSTFHIKKKYYVPSYACFIQTDAPAQWLHVTVVSGSRYKRCKCFTVVPLSLWAAEAHSCSSKPFFAWKWSDTF